MKVKILINSPKKKRWPVVLHLSKKVFKCHYPSSAPSQFRDGMGLRMVDCDQGGWVQWLVYIEGGEGS